LAAHQAPQRENNRNPSRDKYCRPGIDGYRKNNNENESWKDRLNDAVNAAHCRKQRM
jgi:hypothetical protein